jgi:hypothetical protein
MMRMTRLATALAQLKAVAVAAMFSCTSLVPDAKAAPENPCRQYQDGYPNGYSNPDSMELEDKTVSFTNGMPGYRVLSVVTNTRRDRMANIEWEESGSVKTAWVNSWILACVNNDPPSPSLPPFTMGDSLEKALANRQCDLQASSEWAVNPAIGLSRQFTSHRCGLILTFVKNADGNSRLHHGSSSMQGGGGYLLTNEGIGIGTPEVEAVAVYSVFENRSIPQVTIPGRTLSVDGLYDGYIFRIENGVINSIEFGHVRE